MLRCWGGEEEDKLGSDDRGRADWYVRDVFAEGSEFVHCEIDDNRLMASGDSMLIASGCLVACVEQMVFF